MQKLRKDLERRVRFEYQEIPRRIVRNITILFQRSKVPAEIYRPFWLQLLNGINGFRTVKHYCLVSRRHRGVLSHWNLGRQAFRTFVNNGVLTGFRHRAW
jgi:ribosomal protein S14